MAAARCDALCGASGLTCSGRKRGSIPLTASKTDAETNATTRPVTFGAVPAVRTVVFITPIHSSTGSGVAADTCGGLTANSAAISKNATLRAAAPIPWWPTERTTIRLHSVDLPIACTHPDGAAVEIRGWVIRSLFRLDRLQRHTGPVILSEATSKVGQTAVKWGKRHPQSV